MRAARDRPFPRRRQGKHVQHLRDRLSTRTTIALLERHVTAERVKAHFAGIVQGEVLRYTLPQLGAMNFVLRQALGGGVTRSLALDAHGKCLSSVLLEMDIPDR